MQLVRSPVILATEYLLPDEPCFNLSELIQHTPDNKHWDRYQIIMVVRNDRLAMYREDLGPADSFRHGEFRIPGGVMNPSSGKIEILHTVAQLQDIADWLRNDPPQLESETPTRHDFWERFYETLESRRLSRRRISTFGYGGHIQRGVQWTQF